jgi:HEAT repeat protein
MDGLTGKRYLPVVLCLLGMSLAGCSEFAELPTWVPFAGPVSDKLPGVTTPSQRLAALQKLSDNAAWKRPPERRKIAEQLAAAFHVEEDELIRAEIVRTMGKFPGPGTDAVLRAAIDDKEAEVRLAACEAWAERGGAEATTLLSARLAGDLDKDVRLAAARGLGDVKDPAAIAALGSVLDDADPAMQYYAVVSLQKNTGKDFGNDVNQWRQYVKGETPKPAKPVSIAERLRQMF